MISITVTDPSKTSQAELRAIAEFLLSFTKIDLSHERAPSVKEAYPKIDTVDNPATGAPAAAEVFSLHPKPSEVFKAPNALGDAPFTAGVATLPIVPVVPPPTLIAASAVPLPPVPQIANAAQVVVPPTVSHAATVDVDLDGVPWDNRIHSGSKSKNKDGRWKVKKNMDPSTVATVMGELRQVMAIPGVAFVQPVNWPFQQTAADMGMVTPPPPPAPVIENVAVPSAGGMGFPQFLPKVTSAVHQGRITNEQVIAALHTVGIPAIPLLANRPDLIAKVDAILFPVGL